MLAELIATPGVVEDALLRGPAGVMALHGGLEEGTAEIARDAAVAAAASRYGVTLPDDLAWHVPSIRFDPAQSPQLRRFLDHVQVVVSVHGFGRKGFDDVVLVGGRNRRLAADLARSLRAHTPLDVVADLERMPKPLRGTHPRNPVNLPAHGGAQLELSPGARRPAHAPGVVRAVAAVLRAEQRSLCARRA